MKTITIGRDESNDIVFSDPSVSRRHAILKISALGKCHIVDMSSNGTLVNGVKIKSNVPVPVTRQDLVTFPGPGRGYQLEWSRVPNPRKKLVAIGCAVIALAVAAAAVVAMNSGKSSAPDQPQMPQVPDTAVVNAQQPADEAEVQAEPQPAEEQPEQRRGYNHLMKRPPAPAPAKAKAPQKAPEAGKAKVPAPSAPVHEEPKKEKVVI
ncbi:MAG: FHA domain-containing protein [Bacteroidales bacterium]|nr:FHA domain-containing protein [Bacteroidales bacterium]